jgi:hypothetical protein
LHGRKQESDQDRYDCDHNQQLNERKAPELAAMVLPLHVSIPW